MSTPSHAAGTARYGHWRHWWLQRLPRRATLTLTQHNVYILPTGAGFMLGLTLTVLLIGSINFQLNLGYLLTFLLAGAAAAGMFWTHGNLRGLELHLQAEPGIFAGDAMPVSITLHNPGRRTRHGIVVRWLVPSTTPSPGNPGTACCDVPAQGSATLQLACVAQQRGRHPLPALHAETRFPLGTFRVWCWWRPAADMWVYPAPEAHPPPLPMGEHTGPLQHNVPASGQHDDMQGLRPYRRGDPLKWIAWKKAARLGDNTQSGLLSREFSPPCASDCWLDHAHCGVAPLEGKLSRLCAWVLMAEQAGLDYGLHLPGLSIPPGQGPAHQRQCLQALACA